MRYFLFALLLTILPITAYAREPLTVQYGFYAGGFNVAIIDATYTFTDTNYGLEAKIVTAGMLGKLAPWSGDIVTEGRVKNNTLTPAKHEFSSVWRGDRKSTLFQYDETGTLIFFTKSDNVGETDNNMPPEEVYADKPVDMLTALLNATRGESCETSQPSMDAKRRFNMIFRSKGEDILQANRYNQFNGPTEICEVEIVPVAGKWREKPRGWMNIQNQAKSKGQLPRLWFGKVRDDIPAIPVRMLVKTNYGTMLMHLQGVKP